MKTIKIRDVRGPVLEELARDRQMVGITSNRVLIGVLLPITQAWVEDLIEANFSRVEQNVLAGERELASGAASTLDEVLDTPERAAADERSSGLDVPHLTRLAAHGINTLRSAVGLEPPKEGGAPPPPMRPVRIGDLSGAAIEEAGQTGQTLAVTNGRALIGVLVPVTQRFVEHLVDQNMSRILWNIAQGEKQAAEGGELTTLDSALDAAAAPPVSVPPPQPARGLFRPPSHRDEDVRSATPNAGWRKT